MKLSKYEEQSYNKILKKYNDLFKTIAIEGKHCFNKDSHTIFNKDTKKLTKIEKYEIKKYWANYFPKIDLNYHRYYIDKTGKFDVKFIPDDIFAGYIDPYLNNRQIEPGIADKNYFDMYFKGLKMPETYLRIINGTYLDKEYKLIDKSKAIQILLKKQNFIVKPSMATYGGKGVKIFKGATKVEIENFLGTETSQNLIFQEIVKQSYDTAFLHPESLNTIRIMTLLIDNKIKILPAIAFRIGRDNSCVDNASFGGIYCKVNKDGTLSNFAYDALGEKYTIHPNGGCFSNVKIRCLKKIYDLIKEAAQRLPHFRLIGWDIAIDETNNPLIIEANLTMSGLDVIETISGPLFGEYTDLILDEVFNHPKKPSISMDISQYV